MPDIREQVALELEQLERLLEVHASLIHEVEARPPDPVELSALAALLHSFYNGVENICKRITFATVGELPQGELRHRKLLEGMSASLPGRPAVFSPGTKDELRLYMDFRHVFRHAYTFELRWTKMAGLVHGCEDLLRRLEQELEAFLQELG